jgi:hypothetical protein
MTSAFFIGRAHHILWGSLDSGRLPAIQFQLTIDGYRHRGPEPIVRMFRNNLTVVARGEWSDFSLAENSIVVVIGTFVKHETFDVVSSSSVENGVIDVADGGYIGLINPPRTDVEGV